MLKGLKAHARCLESLRYGRRISVFEAASVGVRRLGGVEVYERMAWIGNTIQGHRNSKTRESGDILRTDGENVSNERSSDSRRSPLKQPRTTEAEDVSRQRYYIEPTGG